MKTTTPTAETPTAETPTTTPTAETPTPKDCPRPAPLLLGPMADWTPVLARVVAQYVLKVQGRPGVEVITLEADSGEPLENLTAYVVRTTDGRDMLFLSPGFWTNLTLEEMVATILHELAHLDDMTAEHGSEEFRKLCEARGTTFYQEEIL